MSEWISYPIHGRNTKARFTQPRVLYTRKMKNSFVLFFMLVLLYLFISCIKNMHHVRQSTAAHVHTYARTHERTRTHAHIGWRIYARTRVHRRWCSLVTWSLEDLNVMLRLWQALRNYRFLFIHILHKATAAQQIHSVIKYLRCLDGLIASTSRWLQTRAVWVVVIPISTAV